MPIHNNMNPSTEVQQPRQPTAAELAKAAAKGIKLIWDGDTALTFSGIEHPDSLLMLTPATTPFTTQSLEYMMPADGFLDLADAMKRKHYRTRHVPYLLGRGMERRVLDWIDEVFHVVVIICEPVNAPVHYMQEIMEQQYHFLERVLGIYRHTHEGIETDGLGVIYFGNSDYRPPEGINLCLKFPPYPATKLSRVARALVIQDR